MSNLEGHGGLFIPIVMDPLSKETSLDFSFYLCQFSQQADIWYQIIFCFRGMSCTLQDEQQYS